MKSSKHLGEGLLLITKEQESQVNDFSAFLDMRRYKNQAHINKIAPYLRQF